MLYEVITITSREHLDEILTSQLEKLGIKTIDYYLLHGLEGDSWDRLKKLGVIEFLETARAA